MNKTFFRIIVIILIAILSGVGYLILRSEQTGKTPNEVFVDTTRNIFPFSQNGQNGENTGTLPGSTTGDNGEESPSSINIQNLTKIYSKPVAGAGFYQKEEAILGLDENGLETTILETKDFVRFVEQETGHVYDLDLSTGITTRVSGTTIPRVYEAYIGHEDYVALRYLDDNGNIKTYIGKITEVEGGAGSLEGEFLVDNISSFSISKDGSKYFYIYKIGTESVGISSNFDGTNQKQSFSSPFSEWLGQVLAVGTSTVSITSKASGLASGYSYKINENTKIMEKIIGGVSGLTSLVSENGKLALISTYFNNKLELSVVNENGTVTNTGLKTLPEKCVWSKDSTVAWCSVPQNVSVGPIYPDAWYKGQISWSDNIWKFDINTGLYILNENLSKTSGSQIDGVNLKLNEEENNLLFINKKDQSLWLLKI